MLSEANRNKIIFRLTAFWGLVESGLGGILHAFKLPFSGIILNGLSVSILTFIFFYSRVPRKTIIVSLFQVAIIKLLLSPHTPPTAYLAIFFQALISIFVYSIFSINWFSIFLVTTISFLESAFQKVLILTIIYGMNLWEALNIFINKTLSSIFSLEVVNGSFYLVSLYFAIYSISAFFISIFIFRLWKNNRNVTDSDLIELQEVSANHEEPVNYSSKIKKYYFVFIIFFILSVFTYFIPEHKSIYFYIGYLLRTVLVIILWFIVIIPIVNQLISYFLNKKLVSQQSEIDKFIDFIPKLKNHLFYIWNESIGLPSYKRLLRLIKRAFVIVIYSK